MESLSPTFGFKIEFPFADLFDPDDPLSQWIANLSRAANDLLLANRRLEEDFERSGPQHEVIYDIRAVGSHAWELAEFLRKTNSTAVDAFLRGLIDEANQEHDAITHALQDPTPAVGNKSFKATLASARDQAAHYSAIDHKLLRGALRRQGEPKDDGTRHMGVIFVGETFKDSYNQFASELDYQLFCEVSGEDMEPLKSFVEPLNQLVASLIKFATTAIHTFLHDHEDKLTVTKLS
jgi:hypothetical protein